jgi:hypothetical protein
MHVTEPIKRQFVSARRIFIEREIEEGNRSTLTSFERNRCKLNLSIFKVNVRPDPIGSKEWGIMGLCHILPTHYNYDLSKYGPKSIHPSQAFP